MKLLRANAMIEKKEEVPLKVYICMYFHIQIRLSVEAVGKIHVPNTSLISVSALKANRTNTRTLTQPNNGTWEQTMGPLRELRFPTSPRQNRTPPTSALGILIINDNTLHKGLDTVRQSINVEILHFLVAMI